MPTMFNQSTVNKYMNINWWLFNILRFETTLHYYSTD